MEIDGQPKLVRDDETRAIATVFADVTRRKCGSRLVNSVWRLSRPLKIKGSHRGGGVGRKRSMWTSSNPWLGVPKRLYRGQILTRNLRPWAVFLFP